MPIKLSEANTLKYFWEERSDFICFVTDNPDYNKIEEEYPLLFEGIKRIEQGETMIEYTLDKILEESVNDLDDEV